MCNRKEKNIKCVMHVKRISYTSYEKDLDIYALFQMRIMNILKKK